MKGVAAIVAVCLAACTSAASPTPEAPTLGPTVSASVPPSPTSSPPGPTSMPTAPEPTGNLGGFICDFPYAVDGNTARAQITDVRVGAHEGYDRIVFEFAEGIPAMDVKVGKPPFTYDPSGLPLDVEGDVFLILTLRGGTGITPDGQETYSGPTVFTPGFVPDHPPLVQLVQAGDFEAQSEWVAGLTKPVGLTSPGCIHVFALADPDRLVIDLAAP